MDVRERLVEILKQAPFEGKVLDEWWWEEKIRRIADHLISNGVTVQEGKPLDAFLHPVDAYKGLKAKYLVFKADTGERVGNCFVLCPDKDPAAVEAIRAYASVTYNETLAEDIYNWVGKGEPVQEWISVDDRLPEEGEYVLCVLKGFNYGGKIQVCKFVPADKFKDKPYFEHFRNGFPSVTHWMSLPQPPKGE